MYKENKYGISRKYIWEEDYSQRERGNIFGSISIEQIPSESEENIKEYSLSIYNGELVLSSIGNNNLKSNKGTYQFHKITVDIHKFISGIKWFRFIEGIKYDETNMHPNSYNFNETNFVLSFPGNPVLFEIQTESGKVPHLYITDGNINIDVHPKNVYTNTNYDNYEYEFEMPDSNITLVVEEYKANKIEEEKEMEVVKTPELNGEIIDWFEIPEEIAKELSELLVKQSIRETMLQTMISDPVKYEQAEKLLIPVVSKVEALKATITRKYVPEKYRSDKFMWNYDGYEIDKNQVQILNS